MAKRGQAQEASQGGGTTTDIHLEMLKDALVKKFGDGAATSLSESVSKIDYWCSTRSIVVDKVIAGGRPQPCSLLPFGRQVELSGLPSSGKTSMCAAIAAEVQSKGGLVIVTDTEERIDQTYWAKLGVDVSRILSISATNLEDVFRKQMEAIDFARDNFADRLILMIWDSVGSTGAESMITSDDPMSEQAMVKDVRVLGHGMKNINLKISQSKICYIYTNHLYRKIGTSYGDQWETPGGEKLKHFATLRLRLSAIGQIKEKDAHDNDQMIGHKVKVQAMKNSMAPMRLSLEGAVLGGVGFSNDYTIFEKSGEFGLVNKGAWSKWVTPSGEEVKFQGWPGFQEKVVVHPEYGTLFDAVSEKL